jgi:multiple sugar transport system ATP-binding protein
MSQRSQITLFSGVNDFMAEIKLEHITKRFGNVLAVNDLNMVIADQEFVVLLGPSGCGKTTTLRAIAGLEHPEEGNIFIDGKRVNALSPADRDIAFVFQFYALYPHLTVYDNIAFPLKAVKVPKSEIQKRVAEVAALLRIENMLERKPRQLSGGEMQRVALGRAMVRRPKAFLMDEPMANLDAKLRVDMRSELKRLQRELGTTTIFVTHDQVEAMSMADRIAVMHQGVLQQIGTPQEVYNQPKSLFVAGFMGSPAMNLIHGEIQSQNGRPVLHLTHTGIGLELSDQRIAQVHQEAKTKELVFGIRAEHIRVSKEAIDGKITASVHLVESLGSVNIVDIFLGENPETGDAILLRARTHPAFQVVTGQPVWLDFDERHIHLFARHTEKAIC